MTALRTAPRRARLAATAVALALTAAPAALAQIGFGRSGPFEACLQAAYDAWVQQQAELMVNEDPRAQDLDDPDVASWTVATLEGCRKKAGGGDAATESRFAGFMSRWRQHVFDLASGIRRRGASD